MLDAIKKEFVTRELFEERFNVVDERFNNIRTEMNERFNLVDEKLKSLNFKLNIFIAIALIALTLANPTFVKLIEKIFKI